MGQPVESGDPVTIATVWALVEDAASKEEFYADKVNAVGAFKVTMRYYNLSEDQRLVWDSQNLEIKSIKHDPKKTFTEVLCATS